MVVHDEIKAEHIDGYRIKITFDDGSGEIDIAPETLYSKATGEPLPDWAVTEESED